MKIIITTAIFTVVAMFAFSALHAQSESKYRTDMPLSQQLKKGLVPGAQFAPKTTQLNVKSLPVPPEARMREKFSTSLKKGRLPGLRYQTSGGTAAKIAAPKKVLNNVKLPSSAPAVKKDEKKTALKPVVIPSQEDKGSAKANN